MLSGPPAGAP